MDTVDSIIEQRPDSALSMLRDIDTAQLANPDERARYALLMSMALDKNYIDTTDFSVLQPAIDLYLTDGTPDQRLRTLYYQGRIYQNQGDDNNAMKSFIHALDITSNTTDTLTLARTLVAQSLIFNNIYSFKSAIYNLLHAAQLYKAINKRTLYTDCYLRAFDSSIMMRNKQLAKNLMQIITTEYNIANIDRSEYLQRKLKYLTEFGSKSQIQQLLTEIADIPINSGDYLLTLALSYNKIGEQQTAYEILSMLKSSGMRYSQIRYLSILVCIAEDSKDYKTAYKSIKDFDILWTDRYGLEFANNIQYSEERYTTELKNQKETKAKNTLIWMCITGIIFLVFGIIILLLLIRSAHVKKALALQKEKTAILQKETMKQIQNNLEIEQQRLNLENEKLLLENQNLTLTNEKNILESENLRHRIAILENEHEELSTLLASHFELPTEVQDAIKLRIEMLNSILASRLSTNEQHKKNYKNLVDELLANSTTFMDTNRLALKASHPHFIQYFEDKGLTTDEINYVCLYAIGLRGKEVGNYIKKPSHVNVSSTIRKKLGIDKHETNIGIYVRRLLQSL